MDTSDGAVVSSIHVDLDVSVAFGTPMGEEKLNELVRTARELCPVGQLFRDNVGLQVTVNAMTVL